MTRQESAPPASYVISGGTFPFGPFRPDSPPEVYAAAGIIARVLSLISEDGGSQRAYARKASISSSVLNRLLKGENYCDLVTLAKLEFHTNAELWVPLSERTNWMKENQSRPH